tara:strand:- start:79 stop:432 length:354 start_codon:yes stop_codon:yes gene_type:complete
MSIWLIVGLVLSAGLNILLVWYITKILSKLLFVSENLGDLFVIFRYFEDFVENLYGMEMFYGEPIIEELMNRARLTTEAIQEFQDIYELSDEVVEDIEELAEELEDDDTTSNQTEEE